MYFCGHQIVQENSQTKYINIKLLLHFEIGDNALKNLSGIKIINLEDGEGEIEQHQLQPVSGVSISSTNQNIIPSEANMEVVYFESEGVLKNQSYVGKVTDNTYLEGSTWTKNGNAIKHSEKFILQNC